MLKAGNVIYPAGIELPASQPTHNWVVEDQIEPWLREYLYRPTELDELTAFKNVVLTVGHISIADSRIASIDESPNGRQIKGVFMKPFDLNLARKRLVNEKNIHINHGLGQTAVILGAEEMVQNGVMSQKDADRKVYNEFNIKLNTFFGTGKDAKSKRAAAILDADRRLKILASRRA